MLYKKLEEFKITFKNYKTLRNTLRNVVEYVFQSNLLYAGPEIIDAVITKKCNLKCCFCKKYKSGSENISLDNFKILASQLLPDARKLSICSGGEPFIHTELIDILRVAKKYNVWISVVSNGMLLKDDIVKNIIEEELIDSLSFSVDGIIPKTVESIRLGANLTKIINNIKMLINIKNKRSKKKPIVNIRYALMRKNIEELPDAVSFWGKLEIAQIKCNYVSLCDGIDKTQSLYFHHAITEKIFKDATSKAKEYNRLNLILPPLITTKKEYNKKKSPRSCRYPWMFAMIDTDGRVFPCYNSWGAIEMGNIFSDNVFFKKIWNNQIYRDLRRTVNNVSDEKKYSYCSICPSKFGFETKALHFGDELFFNNLNIDKGKINIMKVDRQY